MTDDMCFPADPAGELSTLHTSYDQLHPLHKDAYRLLANHPGPIFSSQAAAAMLRASGLATEETLRELCQRDLLEEGNYGWRMPDPVREHALALAAQLDDLDVRHAAVARAAQTYLRWAADLDTLIDPGRDRYASAYHQMRRNTSDADTTEHAAHLLLVWSDTLRAVQRAVIDQGLHHLAWQFAEVLTGFVIHDLDFPLWAQVVKAGLESAARCRDLGAMARLRALDGQRQQLLGDPGAVEDLSAAATLARRAGDTELEATLAPELAAALIAYGLPAKALTVLQSGLALHQALPERPRRRVQLEGGLALAHTKLGNHDRALELFEQAEHDLARLGDPDLLSRLSADRAELELELGQHHTALAYLNRAQVWLPNTRGFEPHLYCLRADAHLQAGNLDAAHDCLHAAGQRALGEQLADGLPTLKRITDLRARLAQATARSSTQASQASEANGGDQGSDE